MLVLTRHRKDTLKSIISLKDTVVSLPTGHGKFIILKCLLHCPDYLKECSAPSSVLIVFPLVALIESQVADLHRSGQLATRLTLSLNRDSEFDEAIRVHVRCNGIVIYLWLQVWQRTGTQTMSWNHRWFHMTLLCTWLGEGTAKGSVRGRMLLFGVLFNAEVNDTLADEG